jgi:molybdate transport system permease protein
MVLLTLLAACCASAGAYGLAVAFAPANPYRVALAFGVGALSCFYWFAGPLVVGTAADLLGTEPSAWLQQLSRGVGLALAAALAASGLVAERRYQASQRKPAAAGPATSAGPAAFGGALSLKQRLAQADSAEVTDRQSGISFQVAPDATLLEAIEGAGLKINFGCRAGVCGADPIAICEGTEHLSPPGEDELATLRRLGLEGRARLACMCSVNGPVVIDRDPHSAPVSQVIQVVRAPAVDRALQVGLQRVVVVGNGVAGMGVAEALRRRGLPALLGGSLAFTTPAVVIAETFVAAPFFVLAATATFRRIDPQLLLAARSLGASPARVLAEVAVPIAAPGLVAGAAMAWARALGEFGATLMFAGNMEGRTQTLPLAIYTAFESDLGVARALSLLLVAIAIAVLGLVRALDPRGERSQ